MQEVHVVVIPFPERGHVNPMMRLACKLARLKVCITFVCHTEFIKCAMDSMEEEWKESIKLVPINKGIIDDEQLRGNSTVMNAVNLATAGMEEPFEQIVQELKRVHTVPCIISDGVLDWTRDVAKRVGIPRIVFYSSNAATCVITFMLRWLLQENYLPVQEKLEERGNIPVHGLPGLGNLMLKDLPLRFYSGNMSERVAMADRYKCASCILANTVEELEEQAVAGMRTLLPNFWPVGPLLPNVSSSEMWKENEDCLRFLDEQSYRSVIYVSFGSLASISAEQARELADGLELSKVPFVWVVRPNLIEGLDDQFLQGFVERTKGKGIVISWAPQVAILKHRSVSVFLTHCGWNSVMEAICNGVPLLGWPCFAEQNLNCKYIVEEWKIGLGFSMPIEREQVVGLICAALKNEDIRKNVQKLKEVVCAAAEEGGSSHTNLKKFVETYIAKSS